jgi:hypothetical protein
MGPLPAFPPAQLSDSMMRELYQHLISALARPGKK